MHARNLPSWMLGVFAFDRRGTWSVHGILAIPSFWSAIEVAYEGRKFESHLTISRRVVSPCDQSLLPRDVGVRCFPSQVGCDFGIGDVGVGTSYIIPTLVPANPRCGWGRINAGDE